jgi:hypothetical protein
MVRRPLATIAALFAVICTLSVLLPWHTVTVDLGPAGEQVANHNGLGGAFLGSYTIILAGLGALLTVLVATMPRALLPVRPPVLLVPAGLMLLGACTLTLIDAFRELDTCALAAGGTSLSSGHGPAIYITLILSFIAGTTALFGVLTGSTPD